jgi:hypothetical protein
LSDKQMENINKFYEQTGIKRKEWFYGWLD